MYIALTGKGMLNGVLVPREEWVSMIERAGHTYAASANYCDILVASRTDTIKASAARSRGARIMSYDEFPGFLTGAAPASSPIRPATPVVDTGDMHNNPLWGTF